MHRLWRDLTKTKTVPDSVKLQQIKKIFHSLALRLPASDKEKIRVEQKLISLDQQKGPVKSGMEEPTEPILSASSPTHLDKLIEKLNGQVQRKSRAVYECREKILQALFQEKLQSKLIESVLKKVKNVDDRAYFKAYAQILGDLGIEHPLLKDGLNIAHLIHTLNSDESQFRKEVREMVLMGLVDDGKKASLTMEHFQKIITALTNASDKEYLNKLLTTPEKKKSGLTA
jgi:hypothetical protein